MNSRTPPAPPSTKRGRLALRVTHFAAAVVTLVTVVLVAVNLPTRYAQLASVCMVTPCEDGRLSPADAAMFSDFRLTLPVYATYTVGMYSLVLIGGFGVAAVLLWQRHNDPTAVLAALTLVAHAGVASLGDTTLLPGWDSVYFFVLLVWFFALVNLLYLFPDGRFVPRWTRWAFVPWIGWFVGGVAYIFLFTDYLPDLFWFGQISLTFGVFLLGGAAQIYRYRRVSTPAQRQQTKWVVAGFTLYVFTEVLFTLYNDVLVVYFGAPGSGLWFQVITTTIDALTLLALPLSIGAAIFRYRLWDIDLVIRRTLVYSTLTALLAAAYLVSIAVLQNAAVAITGQRQAAWVTVLSTLLIAALFAPVRLGVQRFIDRRFFRRRYDAARTLAAFGFTLRDDVNLDELRADLLAAVEESMQPEHASLWVKQA